MKETVLNFAELDARTVVLDVDAGPNGFRARIEAGDRGLAIRTPQRLIPLPSGWASLQHPRVRDLGGKGGRNGLLLFDTFPDGVENAWHFSNECRFLKPLELSGCLDVVGFEPGFAVGFHPGGAETNDIPRSELSDDSGIAFFDSEGELAFALNEKLRDRRYEIQNVLAMASFGETQLLFVPESLYQGDRVHDCPVVIYDWAKDELRWWISPFLDPLAIAGCGNEAFIYSPIGFDGEIMRLDLRTLETRAIGACSDIQRGLDQGLFLAQIEDSTFSIVDPIGHRRTGIRHGSKAPTTLNRNGPPRLEIVR